MATTEPTLWVLIELFGHQKIAGRYGEQGAFIRVDVPDTSPDAPPERMKFTRLYGPNAIYSITFVDESTARRAASALEAPAIMVYIPSERRLPAPSVIEQEDFEDIEMPEDEDEHWS